MPLSLRTSKITSMSSSMPPWMNTRPVSRRPSARFLSCSFGSQKKVSLVFSDSYSEYYLCDKSLSPDLCGLIFRCLDYPRLWLRSRPREESRVSCLFKRQCRIKEFGSFSSRELRRYHMSFPLVYPSHFVNQLYQRL